MCPATPHHLARNAVKGSLRDPESLKDPITTSRDVRAAFEDQGFGGVQANGDGAGQDSVFA
ncbi:MAG: hypothetical protein QOI21_6310 [Actinomycetota bacterium]|nr:hypothetical protein [Actinomycetota bacterium]